MGAPNPSKMLLGRLFSYPDTHRAMHSRADRVVAGFRRRLPRGTGKRLEFVSYVGLVEALAAAGLEADDAERSYDRAALGTLASTRCWLRAHSATVTIAGSVVVGGALVFGLWGKRADFAAALGLAPMWILAAAILLHVVWLVARSEAWHVCVGAAGGRVSRRRLYRAASLGYLGNGFGIKKGSPSCKARNASPFSSCDGVTFASL
jgi:hypothetical protein